MHSRLQLRHLLTSTSTSSPKFHLSLCGDPKAGASDLVGISVVPGERAEAAIIDGIPVCGRRQSGVRAKKRVVALTGRFACHPSEQTQMQSMTPSIKSRKTEE